MGVRHRLIPRRFCKTRTARTSASARRRFATVSQQISYVGSQVAISLSESAVVSADVRPVPLHISTKWMYFRACTTSGGQFHVSDAPGQGAVAAGQSDPRRRRHALAPRRHDDVRHSFGEFCARRANHRPTVGVPSACEHSPFTESWQVGVASEAKTWSAPVSHASSLSRASSVSHAPSVSHAHSIPHARPVSTAQLVSSTCPFATGNSVDRWPPECQPHGSTQHGSTEYARDCSGRQLRAQCQRAACPFWRGLTAWSAEQGWRQVQNMWEYWN